MRREVLFDLVCKPHHGALIVDPGTATSLSVEGAILANLLTYANQPI